MFNSESRTWTKIGNMTVPRERHSIQDLMKVDMYCPSTGNKSIYFTIYFRQEVVGQFHATTTPVNDLAISVSLFYMLSFLTCFQSLPETNVILNSVL